MKYLVTFLILSLSVPAFAASLDFTTGSNHVVRHGSGFGNFEDGFTMFAIFRLDADGANRGIMVKTTSTTADAGILNGKKLLFTNTTFRIRTRISCLGGTSIGLQSVNNTLAANTWTHAALRYSGGTASTSVDIFKGVFGTPMAETSYVEATSDCVTTVADTNGEIVIGARTTGGTDSLDGRIAFAASWDSIFLTQSEMRMIQTCPTIGINALKAIGRGPVHYTWYGQNGVGIQTDKSGGNAHNGTVTGATYSPQTPPYPSFCML
jgi:hypothetical protein